ncbi:ROK family protein [Phenylobacterium sp.]|uniref:ROK family protein n=1 Tax=Phenylobacterium sp. TaxID=1871053 RepID=UPI0012288965|nr:ROK family protein [Phenylobacterium sp.]THD64960.1 MAG: ROK family protein [Phenylobacterium sp.]
MIRIGVDFGGTKIEAAALDAHGRFQARVRIPSPGSYEASLEAVRDLVAEAERQAGVSGASVGAGIPGSPSPASGLIRNANTTHLNGKPLQADLERVLGRPVRLANDANCFALSEATDGAGADSHVVFGVIVGTGCGAGVTVGRQVLAGGNGIAGEWGHTPLPWARPDELPGPGCFCGRLNCLENWISGPGFVRAHGSGEDGSREDGAGEDARAIVEAALAGEPRSAASLDDYVDRLARGLAVIADILDPDVIVLGGGMSNVARLYDELPQKIGGYTFSDVFMTPVRKAVHGDSSGVRGAAWLWPLEPGP